MSSIDSSALAEMAPHNGFANAKLIRSPRRGVAVVGMVLLASLLPTLLNLLGISFASTRVNIGELLQMDSGYTQLLADNSLLLRMSASSIHHALLEWSAVMLAFMTALLAFAHFRLDSRNIATPIIGIALCCSGVMDAFHILISLGIAGISAQDSDFVPFTWAMARGFNAVILIIGAFICLRLARVERVADEKPNELLLMLGVSTVIVFIAGACMYWAASSSNLPQSYFPENTILRPYDLVPVVLFALALVPLIALDRKMPNMLTGALVACVIPQVVLELHMVFGSISVSDNHFNIAHGLKIMAYLIPLIGLLIHYFRSYTNIDHALYHDPLTNTANRTYFFELAKRSLSQAVRFDRQVALFYMDVNRFKEINDTYGHDVGDAVLIELTRRMQKLIRVEDCFARLGGDEFILFIDNVAHVADLQTVAEKIIRCMQEPVSTSAGSVQANVSIGISLFPDANNLQDLIKHADLAMYEAKKQEDSSYQVYTEALSAKHSREISLQREMPKALQAGNMRLVYQPVFDIRTRTPVAFEALLRWQHPQLGHISPDTFIPIAEKTNFIHTLGLWILEEACAQLKEWQNTCEMPLTMHVNVSARQLQNNRLPHYIANIFTAHGIDGRAIVIEITEGQLIEDIATCRDTINELKRMGITFALDDYGSGFASITHLRELPIDYLKIDRCLIKNSPNEYQNKVLTKTTIELAHSLSLKVVAEGIETKDELNLMGQLGCKLVQGFFLSRPISAAACAELLQRGAEDRIMPIDLQAITQKSFSAF